MICSIEAFKNTSFTARNVPDGASTVYSNFTPTRYPDCALIQNKYLAKLRIATTFENIDGVDYIVVIKNGTDKTFYFVTGITMLNDNCCELDLMMDALTTIGIDNLYIISGWATRCHPASDNLFDNDLPEPFIPSHELQMDVSGIIKLPVEDTAKDLNVVGATFNIEGDYNSAKKFLAEDAYVTTPICPTFTSDNADNTTVKMYVGTLGTFENKLPETYLFEETDKVKEGLQTARSLGLDNGISSSYRIPKEYLSAKLLSSGSLISTLTNRFGSVDTTIPFKYDTDYEVMNNKCYVIWNTFTIMSTCSGERADYKAKEVYENNPDGNFHINVFADLSPNGSPYFSPIKYLGKNNLWQTAIKGMPWQNQPIAYDRQSGWYVSRESKLLDYNQYLSQYTYDYAKNERDKARAEVNGAFDLVTGVAGGVGSLLSANIGDGASQIIGGLKSVFNTGADVANYNAAKEQMYKNRKFTEQKSELAFNATQVYAPTVSFPRDESLQNFVGNYCYVTRTRLAKSDLQKLDVLFNMYGYAVDEPVTKPMFNSRRYFNYIECNNLDIDIKSKDVPMYIRDLITAQLTNGVRIWHVKPNHSLYYVKNEVVK